MHDLWTAIIRFLDAPLLPIGKSHVSIFGMVSTISLLIIWCLIVNKQQAWIDNRLLTKTTLDIGLRQLLSSVARYTIIFIGSLIILQTSGVDISSLTIFAGAIGLGISFGLQTITTNLVSGLILLIEKPIKVGDRIDLDAVRGQVVKISLRATTVVTGDNFAVIIPNSEFIKGKVTNWNMNGANVRFSFPVLVSRTADLAQVQKILQQVVDDHPGVLQEPAPDVIFDEFKDKNVTFALRVYTTDYLSKPAALKSELSLDACQRLKDAGIPIDN